MAQKELTQIYPQLGWVSRTHGKSGPQLSVLAEAIAVTAG